MGALLQVDYFSLVINLVKLQIFVSLIHCLCVIADFQDVIQTLNRGCLFVSRLEVEFLIGEELIVFFLLLHLCA